MAVLEEMERDPTCVIHAEDLQAGRGLHSSASQLNLSRFLSLRY